MDFDTVAETLRAMQHAGLIENRPHKGEESFYVTDGAVAVSASIDGKESFKPPDEDNDGDSDISSDTESEELEEDSHSSVDRNPTFSGKRFQSESIEPTTHMLSKQLAHAATMVTLPVSIISDLTKNANMANEMLANERQLVHDLMRENTELKLRIKDLETATGPIPNQGQNTSKPPLSTVQSQCRWKKRKRFSVSFGKNPQRETQTYH